MARINGTGASALSNPVTVAQGGTGQTTYTNGQILIGNTTGNTLTKATITGTANQVVVTNGTGTITLSLPQSIATTSTPSFTSVTGATDSNSTASFTSGTGANADNFMSFAGGRGMIGYTTATQGIAISGGGTKGFAVYVAGTTGTFVSGTRAMEVTTDANIVLGAQSVLATNATNGFVYIPTSAGAPTGVPTAFTGKVAMEFDTTNNKLMIYDGGWIGVTLA